MEKIYKYDNATIYVLGLDKYNRDNLKKATALFLKKVIIGGKENGYSNTTRNIREK